MPSETVSGNLLVGNLKNFSLLKFLSKASIVWNFLGAKHVRDSPSFLASWKSEGPKVLRGRQRRSGRPPRPSWWSRTRRSSTWGVGRWPSRPVPAMSSAARRWFDPSPCRFRSELEKKYASHSADDNSFGCEATLMGLHHSIGSFTSQWSLKKHALLHNFPWNWPLCTGHKNAFRRQQKILFGSQTSFDQEMSN